MRFTLLTFPPWNLHPCCGTTRFRSVWETATAHTARNTGQQCPQAESEAFFYKFFKRWWHYLKTKLVTWLKCKCYNFEGLLQPMHQDFKSLNMSPNLIWWRGGSLRQTRLPHWKQRLHGPVSGEPGPGFRARCSSSQSDCRNLTSVSSHGTPCFFTRAHA